MSDRLRRWLPVSEIPTLVLVLLLVMVLANSTVAMEWVKGSELWVQVAIWAALVMGLLALVRPLPAAVSLTLGLVGAVLVPYLLNGHALVLAHPSDPFGIPSPDTWIARINASDQQSDASLFLFVGSAAFWVVGGWLAWCVVRWRRPLVGLYPGTAILATNILNSRDEQNGYTLLFLLITFALLLWNSYRASLLTALRSGLKLSSDSRWDFWETGVTATVVVMLVAIFLPPLSSQDATVNVENGVFRDWAQFQQNLSRQVLIGHGGTAPLSIGFALEAGLAGPLKPKGNVVFTYSVSSQYTGPRYFRGVNLDTGLRRYEWSYIPNPFGYQTFVAKSEAIPYADLALLSQQTGTFDITMDRPPNVAPDVLFYPGQLLKINRDVTVFESLRTSAPPPLVNIDRVSSTHPPSSLGKYRVNVQYPNPTEAELRNAGTDYPSWVAPFQAISGVARVQAAPGVVPAPAAGPPAGPLDPFLQKIATLAGSITQGLDNPYDKATAIETYLRSNYNYTLSPQPVPPGVDPIDFFLFSSKAAYCQYFASAMGDLLRASGIPARLVNGYGAGTYDSKTKQYVVRDLDAHTWVEAYFPHLGWVPFEPTPDIQGGYFPIPRAATDQGCSSDAQCSVQAGAVPNAETGSLARSGRGFNEPDIPEQAKARQANTAYWLAVPLVGLLLLLLALVLVSRYLRPRDPGRIWHRLALLSRLAGHPPREGETPTEYGSRLAAAMPEAASPIRDLTDNFVVLAYAPEALSRTRRGAIVEIWRQLRPHLLRRMAGRLRMAW